MDWFDIGGKLDGRLVGGIVLDSGWLASCFTFLG